MYWALIRESSADFITCYFVQLLSSSDTQPKTYTYFSRVVFNADGEIVIVFAALFSSDLCCMHSLEPTTHYHTKRKNPIGCAGGKTA